MESAAAIKIQHPLHNQHPLILRQTSPDDDSERVICDLCQNKTSPGDDIYSCSQCAFNLGVDCALSRCFAEPEADRHATFGLFKSIDFTCHICGTRGGHSPIVCLFCQVMLHKECLPLRRVIKITEHDHRIVRVHSHDRQDGSTDASNPKYCGICDGEVGTDLPTYCCPESDCTYVVHIACAKQFVAGDDVVETSSGEEDQGFYSSDGDVESAYSDDSARSRSSNSPGKAAQVKCLRCCEDGQLTIMSGYGKSVCDGCMLPMISPDIYGCETCHIFVHRECAELPNTMEHSLHPHRLILLPKAPTIDGVFKCGACDQYCHGFSYNCAKCDFYLDVRCSAIPEEDYEYQGHEHPLRLSLADDGEGSRHGCYCSGCHHGKLVYFECDDCNFILDFRCAMLPNEVRHRWDENHPLTLHRYVVYDDSNKDYCEICEREIASDTFMYDHLPWFYRCDDCDISVHPECVLGFNRFVKLGGSYLYQNVHPHPLTLTLTKEFYPPCDNCAEPFLVAENNGDPFCDLALECSECDFVIHRKDPCFSISVKEQQPHVS